METLSFPGLKSPAARGCGERMYLYLHNIIIYLVNNFSIVSLKQVLQQVY